MGLSDRLRAKGAEPPKPVAWVRRPELLLLPNIPKPLHGLAPRTILGDSWWNKTRREAYKSTDYHCLACGVPKDFAKLRQWLEGHEVYETDYQRGRLTYVETVPLCHCCHNYIHDGRLKWLLETNKVHHSKYVTVIQHGDRVLKEAGLKKVPLEDRIKFFVALEANGEMAPWADWRLVLFGKEYKPLFESYAAWYSHFQGLDTEVD